MISETAFIHPLAVVEDSAVGKHSNIWQFASVIRGAVIGEDCTVASGACIDGSRIGNNSIVSQNVAMGAGFLVGENVFIGPNVTLCNDAWPRASKEKFVGYNPAICFEEAYLARPHVSIIIEDGASIGANAVVLPGLTIGAGAMIAAGSVVNRCVPPECLFLKNGSMYKITSKEEREHLEARMRFIR